MSIQEFLLDNQLVAVDKVNILIYTEFSESINEIISFQLYSTTDLSSQIINNACQHLRFMMENDIVLPKLIPMMQRFDFFEDFMMMPSQPQYQDFLLHLISVCLQTKIQVYKVHHKDFQSTIYNNRYKQNKKIRILKHNNNYYPLWKKSFFYNYITCQNILTSSQNIDFQLPILQEALNFDVIQQKTKKPAHKKSMSDSKIQGQSQNQKTQNYKKFMEEDDQDADFLMAQCSKVIDQGGWDDFNEDTINQQNLEQLSSMKNFDNFGIPNLLRQQSLPMFKGKKDLQSDNKLLASLSPQKSLNKCTGRLKFFDEQKNYGFFIMDLDNCDIFVHYDDLHKAGLNKEMLKSAKFGNILRFTFTCMNYYGKYNKSRKAVDVELLIPLQELF